MQEIQGQRNKLNNTRRKQSDRSRTWTNGLDSSKKSVSWGKKNYVCLGGGGGMVRGREAGGAVTEETKIKRPKDQMQSVNYS